MREAADVRTDPAPTDRSDGAGGPTDWSAPNRSSRRSRSPSRPGRRAVTPWRVAAAVLVVLTGWVAWSYGHALAAPGNDPVGIRTTEWLKDHHFTWAVNDIERFWYNHHQPKAGGAPTGALRRQFLGAPTTTVPEPAPTVAPAPSQSPARGPKTTTIPPPATATGHLPAPAPIAPIAAVPLPGEGVWRPLGPPVRGIPAMYQAFLRPDPVHTSLVAAVAWMDPRLVRAVGYAGVQEPGGGPWKNQAPIPADLRPELEAAFNSGFKIRDARGGYYADGRTVRELRSGAATLVIGPDGTPTVGQWGRDFQAGSDVTFARQNLSLIIDNGQAAPNLATDNNYLWGATLGNAVPVWRSGVGVTANGALVYAAGNQLSVSALADVLVHAGAVRAMELDINSAWVDFFAYGPAPAGQPATDVTASKLLPDMRPSANGYFTTSSRDFIAIFRRP